MRQLNTAAVVRKIGDQLTESAALDSHRESATPRNEGPVFLAFRHQGSLLSSLWTSGKGWLAEIDRALVAAIDDDAIAQTCDTVELCLTHSFRPLGPSQRTRALANIHRGIKGIEIRWNEFWLRVSPTEMLARNMSFTQVIDDFCRIHKVPEAQKAGPRFLISAFQAHQFILTLKGDIEVSFMERGAIPVLPSRVSRNSVTHLRDQMAGWMVRNVDRDGRMTYKYWPSRGEESSANNAIRQFMATVCLGRMARSTNDPAIAALAELNLAYNINQFYVTEADLGFIEFQGEIKLGAAALAALAILESPARSRFSDVEKRLVPRQTLIFG